MPSACAIVIMPATIPCRVENWRHRVCWFTILMVFSSLWLPEQGCGLALIGTSFPAIRPPHLRLRQAGRLSSGTYQYISRSLAPCAKILNPKRTAEACHADGSECGSSNQPALGYFGA